MIDCECVAAAVHALALQVVLADPQAHPYSLRVVEGCDVSSPNDQVPGREAESG